VTQIPQWTVFETAVESAQDYDNPLWEVTARATFASPSGQTQEVDAFYDGGRTWRVRFCPDEIGRWTYRVNASDTEMQGCKGEFECVPNVGDNPLYQHGAIRLSENRRYFVHADGAPFFWMGDTAWNGVLKAKAEDWERYLTTRREQGFTAVQFVTTDWRALPQDEQGETAYTGAARVQVNPRFFQRLDDKVAATNQQGLIASPVILWVLGKQSPGTVLPEEDAIRLARYIVARWGAHHVMWILGGDGNYREANAERWQRVGRAVFADRHDRLVTMHPQGLHWVANEFKDETWFDFIGYQSGHGDGDDHVKWLAQGPPANDWQNQSHPIVNLEPNYEAHVSYHSRQVFDAHKVRRALYWSLLVSPTAGVTYGHHGIWFWAEQREVPTDHPRSGEAPTWQESLRAEGAECVKHLTAFFSSFNWWRLRPAPQLLAEQPGDNDPNQFIAAAQTDDAVIAYLPEGGSVTFKMKPSSAQWFNPRTGERSAAEGTQTLTAPTDEDWILCVR
jgi:hypothetical protein